MKLWATRRRTTQIEGKPGNVIEFVPGNERGDRAYFWIGNKGTHYATVDARALAKWIDSLRRDAQA